jgi:hypothetical protein
MTVAAGTDAGNTLLGVAPPAIATQLKQPAPFKEPAPSPTPPPAAAVPEAAPRAAPEAAHAPEAVSATPVEAAPEKPASDKPEPAKAEPVSAAAKPVQKSEPASKPELVIVKEPAKSAPAARAIDVSSSPDSVAASSSDRAKGPAEDPIAPEQPRSSRGLLIAAAAAVVMFGAWYGLRSGTSAESAAKAEAPPAPVAQVSKAEPAPADPVKPPAEPPAAPTEPTAVADPAAPSASGEAFAAADGKKVVIVKVRPLGARFYYKGKKMGGSPMRVELAPGEKRSFEVGHPNFVTRKVVIDGSEPEVIVGLHPKGAPKTPSDSAEAHP